MVIVSKQDLSDLEIQLKLSLVRMELAKMRGEIWTIGAGNRAALIGALQRVELACASASGLLKGDNS